MPRIRIVLPAFVLLLLPGCVINNNQGGNSAVMALIAARAAQQQAAAKPCFLPADQRGAYANPIFVNNLIVQPTPAQENKIDGCASVKFHIDPNGKATDIAVLAEQPTGQGFAAAVTQEVAGSKFKPPVEAVQWHYTMRATIFNK